MRKCLCARYSPHPSHPHIPTATHIHTHTHTHNPHIHHYLHHHHPSLCDSSQNSSVLLFAPKNSETVRNSINASCEQLHPLPATPLQAPWALEHIRAGWAPPEFGFLWEGMKSYKDYEAIYCPPETRVVDGRHNTCHR
jgi:hypothetical protein